MKRAHVIFYEIAALFIIFVYFSIFVPLSSDITSSNLNDCTLYNTGWTISTANNSIQYDTLPAYYITDGESDIWLTKTLSEYSDDKSIGFFSFQQQVWVYINDELVYEFVPSDKIKSLTPGNKWNFIHIKNSSDSCEITIRIHECYSSSKINVPDIYYGTQSGMLLTYIKSESPHLLVSAIMILCGLLLAFFCILYRNKTDFEHSLKWLALFSIFRGMWTLTEANIYSFFFQHLLFISHLSYMVLKISTVAFMEFVNLSFHDGKSKTIRILIIVEYVDFWLSILCQYILGIDFAYTVYITHLVLLIGGIYTCISSMLMFKKSSLYQNSTISANAIVKKNSYGVHVFGSLTIVLASFIDLVRYNFYRSPDVARFSRWGDFIYISFISFSLFTNFVNLLKMGHTAEQLKEAATIDPLTKLLNRSSFEHDINLGNQLQWSSMGVAMLDLNNLKHFNDVHGHGMGDYYIIISSEIICDAFSKFGTVYRIGGDEFCVITHDLSLDNFMNLRDHIEEYMATLKMPSSDLHMEISTGYAVFDANIDNDLKDTMKRADDLMYQRKMELKNHRE